MQEEKISVVRISFTIACGDLILSHSQWKELGGYKGFLKQYEMSILNIKKIKYTTMPEYEFYALEAWEG